jgi:hypothetical protein
MSDFTGRIVRLERMPSSKNGNPRFRVFFAEHGTYPTEVDGSVGYGIGNREYRDNDVEVTLTAGGNIAHVKVVTAK